MSRIKIGDSGQIRVHSKRVRKAENSRQVYEVLNLGVMGFDTIEEVALLREQGVAYEPDLVIICFFLNDAKGGSRLNPLNVVLQRQGAAAALASNSYLLDRALWVVERRRQAEKIVRDYRRSFEPTSTGWRAAQRALEEAAALAEQREFELVLMIFPVLWDLDDGYAYTKIHETVASFARGEGMPVLDLLPAFSRFEGPELWVHPTNQHPNAEAHEIAADELFEFLRREALVVPLPPAAPL